MNEAEIMASVVANTDDAVIGKTLDGTITLWNRGAERLYGYNREDAVGRPVSIIIPPDRMGEFEYIMARIASGQSVEHFETVRVDNKGRRFEIDLTISPIRDGVGDIVGASAIARDITERKRVEAAQRESERRYRATFDQAAVGMAHVGLDGRWLQVNDRLCLLTGYTREELLARTFQDITHPEDLGADLVLVDRLIAGEIQTYTIEKRYHDRSGRLIWVNLSVALVRDEAGEPDHFISVIEDITARKEAEAEVIRKQEHIEALNARLRQAMTETHHRVKNNLQLICALLDLRLLENEGAVPAEDLRSVGASVRTLAAVHDVLTLQAREDGSAHSISAHRVVSRLLELLQQTAGDREIRSRIAPVTLSLRQGTSLALVVNELVSNALKHSAASVEVTLDERDGRAVLEICDDGEGFPGGFDAVAAANTGLDLVINLCEWDLSGTLEFDNHRDGGRVRVSFPVSSLARPAEVA